MHIKAYFDKTIHLYAFTPFGQSHLLQLDVCVVLPSSPTLPRYHSTPTPKVSCVLSKLILNRLERSKVKPSLNCTLTLHFFRITRLLFACFHSRLLLCLPHGQSPIADVVCDAPRGAFCRIPMQQSCRRAEHRNFLVRECIQVSHDDKAIIRRQSSYRVS